MEESEARITRTLLSNKPKEESVAVSLLIGMVIASYALISNTFVLIGVAGWIPKVVVESAEADARTPVLLEVREEGSGRTGRACLFACLLPPLLFGIATLVWDKNLHALKPLFRNSTRQCRKLWMMCGLWAATMESS